MQKYSCPAPMPGHARRPPPTGKYLQDSNRIITLDYEFQRGCRPAEPSSHAAAEGASRRPSRSYPSGRRQFLQFPRRA